MFQEINNALLPKLYSIAYAGFTQFLSFVFEGFFYSAIQISFHHNELDFSHSITEIITGEMRFFIEFYFSFTDILLFFHRYLLFFHSFYFSFTDITFLSQFLKTQENFEVFYSKNLLFEIFHVLSLKTFDMTGIRTRDLSIRKPGRCQTAINESLKKVHF